MTKPGWTLLFAVAIAAAGCTAQPIYTVTDAPITTPTGKNLSMQEVQAAIVRAGVPLGWQITPEKPGRLTGRLTLRSHVAVVDIEHNTKQYSIKYRDSTDLNAKDGTIHRNYNSWVQNLDKSIRAQLSLL
jgi:hypothetical protein